MPSKDPAINRFHEEFDEFYYSIIENIMQEAISLGKSKESIYAYRDVARSCNSLKAFQIPFSSKGVEILRFLARKMGYSVHPEKEITNLNGSVDDEWGMLAEVFSDIRQKFSANQHFEPKLQTRFYALAARLFEEWMQRSR